MSIARNSSGIDESLFNEDSVQNNPKILSNMFSTLKLQLWMLSSSASQNLGFHILTSIEWFNSFAQYHTQILCQSRERNSFSRKAFSCFSQEIFPQAISPSSVTTVSSFCSTTGQGSTGERPLYYPPLIPTIRMSFQKQSLKVCSWKTYISHSTNYSFCGVRDKIDSTLINSAYRVMYFWICRSKYNWYSLVL